MRHRDHRATCAQGWLLAVAVSMAACTPSTGGSPSAGSTTPTTSVADVRVGEEDSGQQVLLRPGQRLTVALAADFAPVELSADGVLDRSAASGGYGTGQPLVTVLTAAAPGELSLSTSTDDPCLHGTPPCSVPQREWRLSGIVAPG